MRIKGELKGKKQNVARAVRLLTEYFNGHDFKFNAPPFYYHCSSVASVDVGFNCNARYLECADLDNLDLGSVSVKIHNYNHYPCVLLIKPLRSKKFIAKKEEIDPLELLYARSTTLSSTGVVSNFSYGEDDEDELREEEPLELYESRIYG